MQDVWKAEKGWILEEGWGMAVVVLGCHIQYIYWGLYLFIFDTGFLFFVAPVFICIIYTGNNFLLLTNSLALRIARVAP